MGTSLKLYELHTYSTSYSGGHAVVLAPNEEEARLIAAEQDERFLVDASCEVVDITKPGIVFYTQDC